MRIICREAYNPHFFVKLLSGFDKKTPKYRKISVGMNVLKKEIFF